jgi:glycerate-2-kinase
MINQSHIIKNFHELATSKAREIALSIAEYGIKAINTSKIIENNFNINGNILKIKDHNFDLSDFENIYLIGFGKAACDASLAIEEKLGSLLKSGVIIDIKSGKANNPNLKIFQGTHPKSSFKNVEATGNIIKLAKLVSEKDLVLIIVSGGGSALLCSSEKECDSSIKIYEDFLSAGGTIEELNILRKHSSDLKGGGLSKLFYPATLVSLIFSDVVSGDISYVASGPTFKDSTTLEDVNKILEKYNLNHLKREIKFFETPKDDKYFEKSYYILMSSNVDALYAMRQRAASFNLTPKIISTKILDNVEDVARIFTKNLKSGEVLLGGGEPKISVPKQNKGLGGRNCHLALEAAQYLSENEGAIFISIASDGLDNSDASGAIVDASTIKKISAKFNYEKEKENFNSYVVFKEIEDLIFTGPTGSNVADLMLSLKL